MNKKLAKKLNNVLPDLKDWLCEPDSPDTLCIVERDNDTGAATFMVLLTIKPSNIESIETYFEMMAEVEDED